jgi:hypothetical protein
MQGACFELTTLPRTISGTAWTGRPLFAAFKQMQFISARNESSKQASTERPMGRKAMNWFGPDNIDSGHASFQLDTRYNGCRRTLGHLLSIHSLKHAADSSTDHGGGKRRHCPSDRAIYFATQSKIGSCLSLNWAGYHRQAQPQCRQPVSRRIAQIGEGRGELLSLSFWRRSRGIPAPLHGSVGFYP